jgi:hypothetical protein
MFDRRCGFFLKQVINPVVSKEIEGFKIDGFY